MAAASYVILDKTVSTASPDEVVEVEVGSSSHFMTAALPTGADTFEKDQARLDAAFDALVEQQAITDALVERLETTASIPDPSVDPTPRKQNYSLLAYYVFSEIPPEEKPADTVLKTLKDLPVGTPIDEIRRASDAFGLDFNFMKTVAKIESG